jgi:hypothetical protein
MFADDQVIIADDILGCYISNFREQGINHKTEGTEGSTTERALENKARMVTQMKFYKTIAIGGGTCEYKTWVTTSRDKCRLHATKMRFLRSAFRITRCDRIKNIRNELHVET